MTIQKVISLIRLRLEEAKVVRNSSPVTFRWYDGQVVALADLLNEILGTLWREQNEKENTDNQ